MLFYVLSMLPLNIKDEIAPLKAVVLGTAKQNGPVPKIEDAYDPKSAVHIKAGSYPTEEDMIQELDSVVSVFNKYGVSIYRPQILKDYNQIFARDIAFVVEDKMIISNILPDREKEIDALEHIWMHLPKSQRIRMPENCHIEGGDVMPWGEYIFVGTYYGEDYSEYITARTNMNAVNALQRLFPEKKVKPFNLRKSNTDAKANALHLDCCFQPIGKGKCIIHKNGFLIEEEYQWLVDFFGEENCFHIDANEMYQMFSNVFSISPEVIISERNFTRLNNWLRSEGFTVEEVPFAEVSKQGGLLRCSTMPLIRDL